mgnify:CR=1 FL=1|tara:strand:- start:12682 stop:13206 length:525 start_codon:yes stop_codon:yes gene_type:complete
MKKNITTIPEINELLKLEKNAQSNGSGIDINSLNGIWKLKEVWANNDNKIDGITSYALRALSATLGIEKNYQSNNKSNKLDIINSIEVGMLSFKFIGKGSLENRQPILFFFFEKFEIKMGNLILLNKKLDIPSKKDMPFFNLIALGKGKTWLSARGKGGGLALWENDSKSNLNI